METPKNINISSNLFESSIFFPKYEKPLKKAFYNGIALLLITACSIFAYGSFIILQPFLKPLFWALLCGSVLHPLKHKISSHFKTWIIWVEDTDLRIPILLGLVSCPLKLFLDLSEYVGEFIGKHWVKILGTLFTTIMSGLIYSYTPQMIICIFWKFLNIIMAILLLITDIFQNTTMFPDWLNYIINGINTSYLHPPPNHLFGYLNTQHYRFRKFIHPSSGVYAIDPLHTLKFDFGVAHGSNGIFRVWRVWMVMTIMLTFFISVTVSWDQKYEKQFLVASYVMWFGLSAHTASYFYYLKLPAFVLFQLLFISGYLLSQRCATEEIDQSTETKCATKEKNDNLGAEVTFHQPLDTLESDAFNFNSIKQKDVPESEVSTILQRIAYYAGNNTSDIYISWVTIACLVTLVLQSGWVPYCIALMLIIYTLKHLCHSFGVTEFVNSKCYVFRSWLSEWYSLRRAVLIPAPISSLNSIFIEIRIRSLHLLRESSDSVASVVVILALVMFLIFGSMFLVVQAYTEGIYMMKVGGSVINQTVVHNPELTQLLPEGWEQKMDSVLNNAYTYGRQGLSKLVRNMLTGVEEGKAEELEKRALEVWDRVYQAWMMSAIEEKTTVGPKVTSSAVYQTWDHFLDAMHKTPELVSMSALTQLAQNNMSTLTSGLESAWDLIRGNASLVFSFLFTILTVVFSHSFAVLNFCISMIVFLTALFYLLSSSRNLYKPVEVITALSPVFGSRLAFAMENAVKEVLTASFKLALFYGMWTWLIHNLFQMNIVYIPSVLAAMLAVVPALGTYWACLPAVLDLWLAQGKNAQALTLAMCQFLPTLFVDATIYTEIKEGHPYLTGLAVAGGLFYMGMEGAIIGPLILCCLYVIVSLSSAIMQDASTPTSYRPTPGAPH